MERVIDLEVKEQTGPGLEELARQYGTPLFIVDHQRIRDNYGEFKDSLPRVQAYYAVKANSNPEIVRTLYKIGASFDVASMPEFRIVYENIKEIGRASCRERV